MGIQSFRSINSGKPFRNTANEYLAKGWQPIPLPPKEKFPPPTGFTGRNAHPVTGQQVTDWVADPNFAQESNIGIHLDSVTILDDQIGEDVEYDVIGIDVDITDDKYDNKGNLVKKGKSGGDTIEKMEADLGSLPETFMSTAHGPGARAGIRFYLVPSGLKWPGKIGDSVDCIQAAHRYAVVAPSWHPTAGQYAWYRTTDNAALSGDPHEIPDVAALPMLPQEWVDHLTSGIKDSSGPADQDSTVDEILKWFKRTTAKGDMCRYMEKQVSKARDAFEHDIHSALRDMQRAIVAGGIEGHPGGTKALNRLKKSARRANRERVATNAEGGIDDGQGGKMHLSVRSDEEFEKEWNRSLWGAIRLVKGEVDEGVKVPQPQCACITTDLSELQDKFKVNPDKEFDPSNYRYTDDGNAEMFLDLYGKAVRFTPETEQWYILQDNRWRPDIDMEVFRMFHGIRDTWLAQEKALWQFAAGLPNGDEKKAAVAKATACKKHADVCGSAHAAPRCLTSLSRMEGISVPLTSADAEPHLLGCVNGVLELKDDGAVTLRDYDPQEFITRSTAVPYIPWETIEEQWESGEGEYVRGVELLKDYFDKFIPDEEMRDFIQKAFGVSLFGENQSKKMFFFNGAGHTGKSTLVNLFQHAMGTYGAAGQLDALDPQNGDRNPALIRLIGTRMVNMAEMGSSTTIQSDIMKRIASGDVTTARDNNAKAKDIKEFVPTFTFLCPANSHPHVKDPEKATGERVCVIPFDNDLSKADLIEGRGSEMKAMCREVILSWAVEGWKRYRQELETGQFKFLDSETWPMPVQDATNEFIIAMSPTGEFEKDYLMKTESTDDVIPKDHMYNVYVRWSRDVANQLPMPRAKFFSAMKEKLVDGRVSLGYHNGKQLRLLAYRNVKFVNRADWEENLKVVNARMEEMKRQADGGKAVSFKTKRS